MGEMQHKSLPERTADVICDMLYRENYRIGAKLPGELKLAGMQYGFWKKRVCWR